MPREIDVLERFGKQISGIGDRADEFHGDLALCDELTHLEVPAFNVTGALAGFHVARQIDSALIVNIEHGGLQLVAKLVEEAAKVGDLCCRHRGCHDFSFGGRKRDALLALAAITDDGSVVEYGPS